MFIITNLTYLQPFDTFYAWSHSSHLPFFLSSSWSFSFCLSLWFSFTRDTLPLILISFLLFLFCHFDCVWSWFLSLETCPCCCHNYKPELKILTFFCVIFSSALSNDVRSPFCPSVSRNQIHFSLTFCSPSLVWVAASPVKGSYQTAQVAWLFSTAAYWHLLLVKIRWH